MKILLMNMGFPFRLLFYPFMTPSAGLAEGMENLSLMEFNHPRLLPPYQLPSPSLRLTLDEGRPLPVLHPSLLFPRMTPPSSPTPLMTPPPTCSMLKGKFSKQRKAQMDLYGPTKRGQRCKPSSPISQVKRESMSLFWKLEREIGLQEALKCFQKAVDSGKEELEHDVMSCWDCWVHSNIVYSERSKYHPNHPHHCCPPWQNCYCLAPEYSSNLSTPHPNL